MSKVVYNLSSFVGGISDYTDKGIAGSGKWSSGLEIRSGQDALVCKQALVQESPGEFEDLILWFIPAPDGHVYGFGDQGRIYRRTNGVWEKVYTEPEGKIKGAALSYRYVSTNTYQPYLFWACDTSLHRKEIPGASDWSDVDDDGTATGETYPKTNLLSADWHYMKVAQQFLLIANANLLAGVGIEDGSYSNEVNGVPLPPSLQITTFTNRGNNEIAAMCSAIKSDEQACIYDIDMTSVDWLSRTNLSFRQVETSVDSEFFLLFGEGKIWYSDLYNKQPVCALPDGAMCKPGGSTVRDNVALFAISGAVRQSGDQSVTANGIYAYGRNKNAGTPCLNLEYPMIADELGGLLNYVDDNGKQVLLVAARVENTYRVMTIDENNKQIGEYESLELQSPFVEFPRRYKVDNIILKGAPIPPGCKVEVFYRCDLTGDFEQAYFSENMEAQDSNCEFTSGSEATYEIGQEVNYFEAKVRLTPSGNQTPLIKDVFIEVSEETL